MASPRSPASASRSSTPEMLTPRSKIKALLATVESSDEEEQSDQVKATKNKSPIKSLKRRKEPHQTSADDSESDVPIRPRGKLASRMQGIATAAAIPVETARERVRRMLPAETDGADGGDEEEGEVEDLPVAPRRLKRRVAREASPDTAESPKMPASPGLFVSSPTKADAPDSEDDLPAVSSDRFKALVERKRQERLAREAEEEARKERREKLASELEGLDSDDGNVSSITDDEGGLKLTQTARPTRKAGKKAIEEMNRETQRMARNMQLAHEAKTRKKVTKASLFERFNFRPTATGESLPPEAPVNSSSTATSPKSDEDKEKQTPPSSPPVEGKQQHSADVAMDDADAGDEEGLAPAGVVVDKGKGKMTEETVKLPLHPKRRVRVRLPMPANTRHDDDPDDELEVVTTSKDRINAVFDSMPLRKAQECQSMRALHALAQVRSPGKDARRGKEREGMTPGELQSFLQHKAREQAKMERDKRLETLRAQGAVIVTAEERERQMQEVEDILGKAREEGERIMQEERAAAKKERQEKGEVDPLAWDSSDADEDYEDGGEDGDEGSAIELSGSEEEEEDDGDDDDDGHTVQDDNGHAEEDALAVTGAPKATDGGTEAQDAEELPVMKSKNPRKRAAVVLSDDEGDFTIEATPESKTPAKTYGGALTSDPIAPTSVLRSAKKTFIPGLPVQGPAGLGLTQIFAGTMDSSQGSQVGSPTQSMMPDFSQFPDPSSSAIMDRLEDMVLDSQREVQETHAVKLNLTQTGMRQLDSLVQEDLASQFSEMMEPTQDGGLQEHTPLKRRFVEPPGSTTEAGTVIPESPLVLRGRLRRKADVAAPGNDGDRIPESSENAFSALQEGARRTKKRQLAEDFNRKKSKAKEMVEDQAEESEDEYAGLGGVDGSDSEDESNASVHEIIDDAAGNEVDERELAAFYANRERVNDEKQVEKLYKDITSGLLRRKRGADYDLSDSDDGGEARRRMKRRQFAKMQKALFADERVKKIAEDPGNQAFLRTIEDRGSDEEIDVFDAVEDAGAQSETPSREGSVAAAETMQRQGTPSGEKQRLPGRLRRTRGGRKPSDIGQVRETLSDLLEDARGASVVPATEVGSDSDEERPESRGEDRGRHVVDRTSVGRNEPSASGSRLAFATSAAASSFRVPVLLRRATANSSLMSGSSTSGGGGSAAGQGYQPSGGFGADAKIKKGAGKKSGVHGFTRDAERMARMQEKERRREEKKVRGAESRAGLVGGLFGRGSFE